MAYEEALAKENELWRLVGHVATTVVEALRDDQISLLEGAAIILQGVTLGQDLVCVLAAGGSGLHADMAYVFEHGHLTLAPADPAYADTLGVAQAIWGDAGHLCGDILRALADANMSVLEKIEVGLAAATLARALAAYIVAGGATVKAQLPYVVAHTTIVLPQPVT